MKRGLFNLGVGVSLILVAGLIACWLRSYWFYDSFRACLGESLLELRCSRGLVVIERASPWPDPKAVVAAWERWSVSEYPAPDIRLERARLGFGIDRKSILVLTSETVPTTSPEGAESAIQKTVPVQATAVQVPMWSLVGLCGLPLLRWIRNRITVRRQRAGSPVDVPPASDCPPEASRPRSSGPN